METKKAKPAKRQVCKTAGELIAWLQQHPADTPVDQGGRTGCVPILFNRLHPNTHIAIEENDGTWDD